MPLSPNFIYYTTLVANYPDALPDSSARRLKVELYRLVRKIQSDTFWNNQISQINVDTNFTFDLIPMLGNQKIVFGDTSNMNEKFDNLFTFYLKVLNRIGWDKYDVLDLRFHNQVVASPSLPYKGPVDHAVASMNWITSIVETEAKNEAVDSTASDDDDQPATDTARHAAPAPPPKQAEKTKAEPKKNLKADKTGKIKDEPKDKGKSKEPAKHR
jgi:cell division protein FtsQ